VSNADDGQLLAGIDKALTNFGQLFIDCYNYDGGSGDIMPAMVNTFLMLPLAGALEAEILASKEQAQCSVLTRVLHSIMQGLLYTTPAGLKRASVYPHLSRESTFLPVGIVNSVETLKANSGVDCNKARRAAKTLGPNFEKATITIYIVAFLFCTMAVFYHTTQVCMRWRSRVERRRHGARFLAEIYTRGCHWIPRLLA
jgi:hypothetical protein